MYNINQSSQCKTLLGYFQAIFCLLLFFCSTTVHGQVGATKVLNPTDAVLIQALTGSGLGISNPSLTSGNRGIQIATFTNGINGAKFGFDSGVLFSTGSADHDLSTKNTGGIASVDPPIISGSPTNPYLLALNPDASNNTVAYSFDITLDANTNGIRIVFQFGSDEYPAYVGSRFNDLFGFFISGPGITGGNVPGHPTIRNVALLPSNDGVIAVNTVNGGILGNQSDGAPVDLTQTQYYINNGHDGVTSSVHIEYNGLTKAITRDIAGLQPGQTYRFTVAIADVGDPSYDSGVLLKQIIGLNEADLSIEKTVDNMTPAFGSNVVFKLKAKNAGPNNVSQVKATDLLPSGYTFVSATPQKGTYTSATGIWDIGNLAINEEVELDITATIKSTGNYKNFVGIEAGSAVDPDQTNNFDEVTPVPTATPQANVGVTKTASTNTPKVGDNITFTITANNAGPSAAAGVIVTDLLPSGYTFVTSTPSVGTYDSGTGVWTIGSLSNGASATLTITATVKASTGTADEYKNTATITTTTQDPTPGNNTSTVTPVPVPQANVGVAKTVSTNTPKVGENVTFTITANNSGASTAEGVTVTDLLPSGYTFVTATPSVGTYAPGTGTWTIGSMANGASATLTVTATVKASTGTADEYKNTATITTTTQDPTPGNNTSTVTPVPVPQANVGVVKTASTNTPKVGDNVTFTITANNAGPSAAAGVTVTDLLPSGYTFVSATPSVGTYTAGTGVWAIGSLANGASATLTVTATVKASTGTADEYKNTATIVTTTEDPTPGNNTSTVTPVPVPQANVGIVKTASTNTPKVGDNVTFTITANNAGPSAAAGVTVTDLLPSGYTFVTATPSVGTYNAGTGVWTIGSLANGASATLTVTATVKASTGTADEYKNTATITTTTQDPTPGNNTSTAIPVPVPQANVGVVKIASTNTPKVGDNVTFTVTVNNAGPSTAESVTVTDILPEGYSLIGTTPSVGNYSGATGVWTVGNLVNGATANLVVLATVNATSGTADEYKNTAIIATITEDPTPGNNTSTVTPVPVPQANVGVTKTASTTTPKVGDNVTFTITANNAGPSAAVGVAVTDVLPSGYTFVSAAPNVGTYTAGTGVWAIGSLANGASATLTVTATVKASTGTADEYKNTATIVTTTEDPTPGNNTSTVTPQVSYLEFVKVASISTDNNTNGKADKDDVITYTFTLKNTGNVALKEISLTDAKISGTVNWTVDNIGWNPATGILAVGKTAIGTVMYNVTQADVDAGAVWNQATVGAKSPNGDPLDPTPSTDDPSNPGKPGDDPFNPNDPNDPDHRTEVPANQVSDLSFVKTASITIDNNANGKADKDDVITYTFTARNTGNTTLNSVMIADPMTDLSALTYTWPVPSSVGVLAPGQSVTATATYTVKQSDVDAGKVSNQATANADAPNGDPLDPTPSTDDPLNPGKPGDPGDPTVVEADDTASYTLVKGAKLTTDNGTMGKADVNDVITYTFTVKNTGKVTLKNVTVSDPLANLSTISPASAASLAPGASATFTATYTVVQTDVDRGSVENVATVNGKGPDGTTTVPPVESTPEDPNNPGTPDPGKTPGDPTVVEADDTASYTLVKGAKLTTDNGTVGKADVNDVITYTFTVKNTGKVTLKNVTVSDPLANLSTISPASAASLAPGASATFTATYTVVQTDVDRGSVENVATVNGKGPDGTTTVPPVESTPEDPNNPGTPDPGKTPGDPTVVEADDTASYTLVKGSALTTDNGTLGKADVNDVITYTFTVKNTGKVTLKDVRVSDPLANLSTISPATVASLAPGASATFTATYTVVQADVDRGSVENVAMVNGNGPDGTTTVPPVKSTPEDPNNPGTPDPGKTPGDPTVVEADDTASYSLVKGAKLTTDNGTVGKADVNDVITYTFTVKNTGKVTLKNVTVSDPLANLSAISPASAASLAPGTSATFTATYTVVQTDVDRGSVENVATVNGKGPDGTTTVPPVESTPEDPNNPGTPDPGKTPGDPTTVEADDVGELKVVKTSLPVTGFWHAGDKIEYLIEVSNTGKVTLFDVVVTDANADVKNVGTIAKLEVGKTVQLTAFHTITQADMINGFVSNIAKAEGKDPKDNPVTGESTSGKTPNPGDPTDPNCADCTITPLPWVPIEAVVDTPPVINGKDGGKTPNVLDNDKLNNNPVDPKDVTVTVEKPADPKTPGAPVPTLDPKTGIVTVNPETPAGEYEITYKICEVLNPNNCSTTTVTIVVEAPLIEAVVDTPPAINGKDGGKTPSVLDNDKLNNKPVDPKDVTVTVEKPADPKTPGAPVPTLDPKTGIVTVDPETPAGEYEITYKICEVLNPTNCSTTTVTIVVEAPLIEAVVDTPPAINGKDGGKTANVLDNDKLNNKPVDPKDVTVTVEKPADPKTPGAPVPTLDPKTGIVTVDPETPAGEYKITYKICEVLNPNNCSTTTVTIVVEAPPIEAVVDTPPAINGKDGGKTPSVLDNDKLNNKPVDPKDVTVTVEKPADPKTPGAPVPTLDPKTGIVTVDPETPAGEYEIMYKICEVLNPNNCSSVVVKVVVAPAPIVTVDDPTKLEWSKEEVTTESVLKNDSYNGKPIDLTEVTLKPGVPSNPGLTMNADGTITVAPSTRPGTYTYPYTVCEVLNPTNCRSAVATITIEASNVFIPNTFTPNGDGINDTFEIVGIENYDQIGLTIVNRWGNEVYRNERYDNRWNGAGLNEGTYYYIVTLKKGGQEEVRKGWVLIKTR